jgi:hypothetical protein
MQAFILKGPGGRKKAETPFFPQQFFRKGFFGISIHRPSLTKCFHDLLWGVMVLSAARP